MKRLASNRELAADDPDYAERCIVLEPVGRYGGIGFRVVVPSKTP